LVANSFHISGTAKWISLQSGRPATFIIACLGVVAWACTGPIFGFSETWQLAINTGTSIITFFMVFLIQNMQNRDMTALQLKLDELIRVNQTARNRLLNLEEMSEDELVALKGSFARLAANSGAELLHEAARDHERRTRAEHRKTGRHAQGCEKTRSTSSSPREMSR